MTELTQSAAEKHLLAMEKNLSAMDQVTNAIDQGRNAAIKTDAALDNILFFDNRCQKHGQFPANGPDNMRKPDIGGTFAQIWSAIRASLIYSVLTLIPLIDAT